MLQNEDADFNAIVNAVDSNEKNQAQKNSAKRGFPKPDYCAVGNRAIVRFVNGIAETALDQGKPGSGRAKLFNVGWVKDDNDKSFPLTLPAIINGKPMYNSVLCDFIDKVLARSWIDNPNYTGAQGEEKGDWKYFYADRNDYGQQQSGEMTLKDIFWKVYKSGVSPTSQYYKSTRSWRGQTIYVANVIDRLDYGWHQKNKKTKILVKSVKVKDDNVTAKDISFYAMGKPLNALIEAHGQSMGYDVLIVPPVESTDRYTLKNLSKLKEKDYWDEVAAWVSVDDRQKVSMNPGFTEEEATWEPIDIDKFYSLTRAKDILAHFGKTIKNFDMMTGSNFYEQLQAEAAADEKVKGSKKAAQNASNATPASAPVANTAPVAAPVNPAPVQPQPVAPVQPAQPVVNTQSAPVQPGINTMTNQVPPVVNVTAPAQPVAQPVTPQPSFNTAAPVGAPEPLPVSPEAQMNIDQFYDSLDD